MYLLGHVGVALLVVAPAAFLLVRVGRARTTWIGVTGLLSVVMLPDVDLHLSLAHRGLTHTVWVALLLGGLLAAGGWWLGPLGATDRTEAATVAFATGGGSVTAHLLGDVLTPMGVRPFTPLSSVEFSLALVAASDPAANLALFVAGAVTFVVAVGCARADVAAPASPADRDDAATAGNPERAEDPLPGD